jgi:hypothetical protein
MVMLNNVYLNYYFAECLANRFHGKTCFVSRRKKPINIPLTKPFYTLHSLVYKVLGHNGSFTPETLKKELTGPEMFQNVKISLEKTLGREVSKEEVLHYYYKLREHQNYGVNISTTDNGLPFLNNYQQTHKGLDWEESLQLATWYLNQDIVTNLHSFNYRNIILVQPELLTEKRNKNALDFFRALCNWSTRHTNWEIYSVTSQGIVYRYQNGSFQKIYYIDLNGGCNHTIAVSN